LKLLRKILLPFSLLYGGVTSLRNYFYDKNWLESRSYNRAIICVGNLSTGGTGKSPMIEYLIQFLRKDYQIAVLSRGYRRKTKGYQEVLASSTAEDVGDEPLQFKQNFPESIIAVCADRREGIENLESRADVILLDDGFQHRSVNPSTKILLTSFNDLYISDYVLPSGNLREFRKGAKRADIIIVTKCPERVAYAQLQQIQYELRLEVNQKIFFSKIGYGDLIYGPSETQPLKYLEDKKFTLVTGIANPQPLIEFLDRNEFKYDHSKFSDHHNFSDSEVNKLMNSEIILTTEKDYMRLQPKLGKFAIYFIPIKTIILNNQEAYFQKTILERIKTNQIS